MDFKSLEKGKFVFQKSLSETPSKPDRVSFCTPNIHKHASLSATPITMPTPHELISEKLLILLRNRPCLELIIVSSNFQVLFFLQDKLLESVGKVLIPVNSLKNYWTCPFNN